MSGRETRGFTLVEVLVVTVVIGVLAAVSVPTFLNQRTKSYNAAMKSDLRSLVTAQEAHLQEHESYTTDMVALWEEADVAASAGVSATVVSTQGPGAPSEGSDSYCLRATHVNASVAWYVDSAQGSAPTQTPCV